MRHKLNTIESRHLDLVTGGKGKKGGGKKPAPVQYDASQVLELLKQALSANAGNQPASNQPASGQPQSGGAQIQAASTPESQASLSISAQSSCSDE